ncbi:MAG TPA: GNAT family N-acetyltransferase, partial [Aggregatilineales bacterium]|nr:GNAT family N-acetyltransferase [Aggregatilineales bacterium]
MPILTFRPALMLHPYQSSLMVGVDVWADGEIIGNGWLTRWGDVAEISDLFITPPYRNLGVGTALIRHLAEIGQSHGAQWVEIGVDEGNSHAKR